MHLSKVVVSTLYGILVVFLDGEMEYDSLSCVCGLALVVGWLTMLGSLECSDLGGVLYLCLSRFLSRGLSLECLGGEGGLSRSDFRCLGGGESLSRLISRCLGGLVGGGDLGGLGGGRGWSESLVLILTTRPSLSYSYLGFGLGDLHRLCLLPMSSGVRL